MRRFIVKSVLVLLGLAILGVLMLRGCVSVPTERAGLTLETRNESIQNTLDVINNAQELRIVERWYLIGAAFRVYADGNRVGLITGERIRLLTETLSFHNNDGILIKTLQSEIALLTPYHWQHYDYTGNLTLRTQGRVGVFDRYDIRTSEGEGVGEVRQNFNPVRNQVTVRDPVGNDIFNIQADIFHITSAYTMSVLKVCEYITNLDGLLIMAANSSVKRDARS